MKKSTIKKIIPHAVAVIIFIIIGLVYFSPQLQGYDLRQSDYDNYLGMSKEIIDYRDKTGEEPLWTNAMFSGMPAYQISTIHQNYIAKLRKLVIFDTLNTPLAYLFLCFIGFYILLICLNVSPWLSIIGAVAFGFSSINILYLGTGHITKVHSIALIPPVLGSILFAYRKRALLGGILFAFFLSLHLSANHIQETYYMLFFVIAIAIVELFRHYKEKLIKKFVKVSALLLLGGILGVLPTISNLIVTYEYGKYTTRGKSELTINADNENMALITDNESKNTKGLDPDYIKQYSLGYGEVWSLIIPNVKGGPSGYIGNNEDAMKNVSPPYKEAVAQSMHYWGEQLFTGGAFYFGATVFLLFFLGLLFVKDDLKWAVLGVSVLAVVLSWKYSGILDFFIYNVPLFSKFRDTKMMLVLVQVAFPLMGVLFMKEIIQKKINQKKLLMAIGGVVLLLLLFLATPSTWFDFFSKQEIAQFDNQINSLKGNGAAISQFETFKEELQNARISIFKSDVLRTLYFVLLIGAVIVFYNRKKFNTNYLIIIIGLLILVDLWAVDKRYLNNEKQGINYNSWVKRYEKYNPYDALVVDKEILAMELAENNGLKEKIDTEISKFIKENDIKSKYIAHEKEKITFRELNLSTNYRVFSLQSPFNSSRESYFHKSVGGYHGAKLKKYQELIEFRISKEQRKLINFLNSSRTGAELASLFEKELPTLNMLNTKYIIYNPSAKPFRNPYALGNAWFVEKFRIVASADSEIVALNYINPAHEAVIHKQFADNLQGFSAKTDSNATISMLSYAPNRIVYESDTKIEQLAVFSEIYYDKGWNAYIDGKIAPYFRANYVLRAMLIPKGKHTIEFKFEPETFYIANYVSLSGSILLMLLVIASLFITMKASKQVSENK